MPAWFLCWESFLAIKHSKLEFPFFLLCKNVFISVTHNHNHNTTTFPEKFQQNRSMKETSHCTSSMVPSGCTAISQHFTNWHYESNKLWDQLKQSLRCLMSCSLQSELALVRVSWKRTPNSIKTLLLVSEQIWCEFPRKFIKFDANLYHLDAKNSTLTGANRLWRRSWNTCIYWHRKCLSPNMGKNDLWKLYSMVIRRNKHSTISQRFSAFVLRFHPQLFPIRGRQTR